MNSQLMKRAALPWWAQDLAPEVLAVVREEAMRRGVPAERIVKEWAAEKARTLIDPAAKYAPTDSEGLQPEHSDLPV